MRTWRGPDGWRKVAAGPDGLLSSPASCSVSSRAAMPRLPILSIDLENRTLNVYDDYYTTKSIRPREGNSPSPADKAGSLRVAVQFSYEMSFSLHTQALCQCKGDPHTVHSHA